MLVQQYPLMCYCVLTGAIPPPEHSIGWDRWVGAVRQTVFGNDPFCQTTIHTHRPKVDQEYIVNREYEDKWVRGKKNLLKTEGVVQSGKALEELPTPGQCMDQAFGSQYIALKS